MAEVTMEAMADTAATGASGQPRLMLPQAMAMVDMADTEATADTATGASVQPMLRLSLRPSPRLKPTPPPWLTPLLMLTLGATEDTTEATADTATATAGARGV